MRSASTLVTFLAVPCLAATIPVGPSRAITQLSAVNQSQVMPGDVIEVDGNATYQPVRWTRSGAAGNPIVIRGLRAAGARPRIMGGTNTIEVEADHVVVEGFELTGGSFRCFFHHGDDLVLRDSVVHDCPAHGVLGADQGSGSLLMEYVEVHHCGNGTSQHQIYMATDEVAHPGAVFRMQHCYVHDATGGNNVKSRAERNEIYFNWIEGAQYHELELIGPDPNGAAAGWTIDLKREDSDVVGNVLKKTATTYVARIGGDATGWSKGRYRFVNNTIIVRPGGSAVFRLFDELESVEMHNNVIVVDGTGAPNVLRANAAEMQWVGMVRRLSGSNNWLPANATNVPMEWTAMISGASPGLANVAMNDPRPVVGSPLIDAATTTMPSPPGAVFPNPLAVPTHEPPLRVLMTGAAPVRPAAGALDVGAYEFDPGSDGGTGGGAGGGGATGGGGGATGGGGGATGGGGGATGGGGGATGGGGGATGGGGGATGGGGGATGGGGGATGGGGGATGGGGGATGGGGGATGGGGSATGGGGGATGGGGGATGGGGGATGGGGGATGGGGGATGGGGGEVDGGAGGGTGGGGEAVAGGCGCTSGGEAGALLLAFSLALRRRGTARSRRAA
ncbi:MAG: hypothetical protein IT380_20715 [Myxococcales bacterium]|nr:hypothetical protein [Myxococcales bacterium]